MLTYALIDTTSTAPQGALDHVAAALDTLYARFADGWGFVGSHGIAAAPADPVVGASLQVRLVSSDAAVPDALGFHDVANDVPFVEIELNPILQNGGDWLRGGSAGVSVASVIAHELFEASCDLYCGNWAWNPASGLFLALEVSDPVQSSLVSVTTSDGTVVDLSDAVLPAFFDAQAPQDGSVAFSLAGVPTAPFQIHAGGSGILFDPTKTNDPNGPISSVWGDAMPAWVKAMKQKATGRLARRIARALKA